MSHNEETPAGGNRRGASEVVLLAGERTEDNLITSILQRPLAPCTAASMAEQYRAAAIRNHRAALDLGGREGHALAALAQHYQVRASAYDIVARRVG